MRRGLTITVATAALVVCAVPAASAADTWTVQPTPTPADGVDGQFLAVSCFSAANCTAVGGYTSDSGPVPLAEHWDGSAWTVQATPSPSGASYSILEGVSCPSAANCTAVGVYYPNRSTAAFPLAEHWDGSTWTIEALPTPAGADSTSLTAVSCPSAASCTAIGDYDESSGPGRNLAENWNGSTWTIQTMPIPSRSAALVLLKAVSCTAPDKCTAAGWFARGRRAFVTLIERDYSGSWVVSSTLGPSATLGQLSGVSCTGRDNCVAVGEANNGQSSTGALAEHWNGSTWTVQATPGSDSRALNAVWCVSAASCTAVGTTGSNVNDPVAVAERYSAGTWRTQATARPALGNDLVAVSCTSASTCTAAGYHPLTDSSPSSPLAEQN